MQNTIVLSARGGNVGTPGCVSYMFDKKGQIIIDKAEEVLRTEFPELKIQLRVPDEKTKRHGQAVAAASLPALS